MTRICPPEQALGEIDNLDERADVFGLGAILCEILTGKPPYVGTDSTAVFRQASRGKLGDCMARLEACGADAALIALTKHCLELEPKDRPRDANALAERVSGYLQSVETKLRETELAKVDAQVRAEELHRRQKLAFTAGAGIAASLVIGNGSPNGEHRYLPVVPLDPALEVHPELFDDSQRAAIAALNGRRDSLEAERLEPVFQDGPSGFCRQPSSPVRECQPPADLRTRLGGHKATEADQRRVELVDQGPLAEPVLLRLGDRSINEAPGLFPRPRLAAANELHHTRI